MPKCDLCDDLGPLSLRGKCHPTAPLRMEIDHGVLSVYCYVPECNRLIVRFVVQEERGSPAVVAACELHGGGDAH